MRLLLRKVNDLTRIQRPADSDWLPADDAPASAVREFSPSNNSQSSLSVWSTGDDNEYLDDVLVAIVSSWSKAGKLPYLVFPEEHLSDAFQIVESEGETPYSEASHFHRDIIGLTARKVGELTALACANRVKEDQLEPDEVIGLLVESVRNGRISLEKLNRSSKLTAEIKDRLDGLT